MNAQTSVITKGVGISLNGYLFGLNYAALSWLFTQSGMFYMFFFVTTKMKLIFVNILLYT